VISTLALIAAILGLVIIAAGVLIVIALIAWAVFVPVRRRRMPHPSDRERAERLAASNGRPLASHVVVAPIDPPIEP
jgi:hypothetical protein